MLFDILDGIRFSKPVIPAKAGIQCLFSDLYEARDAGSGFRQGDELTLTEVSRYFRNVTLVFGSPDVFGAGLTVVVSYAIVFEV